MQQQDGSIWIRQLGNIQLYTAAHLVLSNDREGRPLLVNDRQIFNGFVQHSSSRSRPLPHPVNTDMRRNLIQPTFKSTGVSQRFSLLVCTQKRLLGQIFCVRRIPDEVADVPRHRWAEPLDFVGGAGCLHFCSLAPGAFELL